MKKSISFLTVLMLLNINLNAVAASIIFNLRGNGGQLSELVLPPNGGIGLTVAPGFMGDPFGHPDQEGPFLRQNKMDRESVYRTAPS